MNQKHLLLLLLMFILQTSFFNTSKAAYILDGITGEEDKQLTTWITIKKSIQDQLWVEGKKIEEVSGVPEGITIHFVPDSLMQAFAFSEIHKKLLKSVKDKITDFEKAYVDIKHYLLGHSEVPIIYINTGCGGYEEGSEEESIAELFEEKNEDLLYDLLYSRYYNKNLVEKIDMSEEGVDETRNSIINWLLSFNYEDVEESVIINQFSLERDFLKKYKENIDIGQWLEILDDFYPYFEPGIKRPHFTNLFPSAFTEKGFFETLDKDKDFLQSAVVFEQECEDRRMIALFRGDKEKKLSKTYMGGMHSISFSRGYYSGVLRDADSSASLRSRVSRYFFGLPAKREVVQHFLFIPPFSWYTNLGKGGELWHPRTTVATSVPFSDRQPITIGAVSSYLPTDKLGILIKLGESRQHYSKVIDYYTSIIRLYDEKEKKFKEGYLPITGQILHGRA